MIKARRVHFNLRDVAVALMRYEGIHEGRWHLAIDVAVTRAEVAPSDQGALPGALLAVSGFELERQDDAPEGSPQVFDAAKENPPENG